MKLKEKYNTLMLAAFCILAISIVSYVLFMYPQPGVADQGDFARVMSVSGLQVTSHYINAPKLQRYYNYIIPDYKITNMNININEIGATSIAYLIMLINFICRVFGKDIFRTDYLAAAYVLIYTISIFMILKYINIRNKALFAFLTLISLFVFYDGNYLVWFNSLFGEPMMITTLMLYIAAWIYYIYHKEIIGSNKNILSKIIFIFVAAFLFIGSKMQVISALPVIVLMLIWLLRQNRDQLKRRQMGILVFMLCLLIVYPFKMSLESKDISNDTHYNSVFYGILKNSKNPRQDLIDMGLNPNMAVEAGKSSYLHRDKYVKFAPHTTITEKEFYSKMSDVKLIKFYITHPLRLIQGMEYTANHAFFTGTSLGKYTKSFSIKPIRKFNRFTLWSALRNYLLPKELSFIIAAYLTVFLVSALKYRRSRESKEVRAKIKLLWSIMFIGILQFPMPYMGNGQADTTKQLYLFNFTFDIMLVVSACYLFDRIYYKIKYHINRTKLLTFLN